MYLNNIFSLNYVLSLPNLLFHIDFFNCHKTGNIFGIRGNLSHYNHKINKISKLKK